MPSVVRLFGVDNSRLKGDVGLRLISTWLILAAIYVLLVGGYIAAIPPQQSIDEAISSTSKTSFGLMASRWYVLTTGRKRSNRHSITRQPPWSARLPSTST